MVGDLELNFGVGVAVDIARDGMNGKEKKAWVFGLGGEGLRWVVDLLGI